MRRLDIGSLSVGTARAGRIDIDRVELGDASLGRVVLSGLRSVVDTGRVTLRQVRTIVSLDIDVAWQIDIGPFEPGASFNFGSIDLPFEVGDVDIPALDDLDLSVPTAIAADSSVTVQPIVDLTFNGASIENVGAGEIRLPSNGFAVAGLGVDTVALSHLGAPDGAVSRLDIGELVPDGPLVIPEVRIDDIELPRVDVPAVASNGPITVEDVGISAREIVLIDLRILRVSIEVRPTLQLSFARLTLDDVAADSSIDAVSVEDIRSPLRVAGIGITDVALGGLRVEAVSV